MSTLTVSSDSDSPQRLVDVFPPGFDSRLPSRLSSNRGPYSFFPEQLFRTLTYEYHPSKHIEKIFVKSIWYGKQKKGARHEFILVEVQDTEADLVNYVVLDRNNSQTHPDTHPNRNIRTARVPGSQSSRGKAQDTFRVSYNGIENELLHECQLLPRQYLEKIVFDVQEPLFLYQLVTLANVISDQSPNYTVAGTNCYWFSGLIWECLRSLRPHATLDARLAAERGRISVLRYTPEKEEINEICAAFEKKIQTVEKRLLKSAQLWERLRALDRDKEGALPVPDVGPRPEAI